MGVKVSMPDAFPHRTVSFSDRSNLTESTTFKKVHGQTDVSKKGFIFQKVLESFQFFNFKQLVWLLDKSFAFSRPSSFHFQIKGLGHLRDPFQLCQPLILFSNLH
jgi:hypothetical protein